MPITIKQSDVKCTHQEFQNTISAYLANPSMDVPVIYKDALAYGYDFVEYGHFVDPDDSYAYYYGDKKKETDITVDPRPSEYYLYDGTAWVLNREKYISYLHEKIDGKTREIISRGATFEGKTFSLSDNAQRNWISLNILNMQGLMTEMPVSTKQGEIIMMSSEKMPSFLGVLFSTVADALQTGRNEKSKLNEKSDTQLLNYNDPRL